MIPFLLLFAQAHVVSVSGPASDAGRAVLAVGGNAVDAAVATGFALAVAWPEAGNIGGGGFMLVRPAGKEAEPVVIDYRETAPASATKDLFATGIRSPYDTVAVPGSVAGLALAHKRFGKLAWADLLAPAIKLAEDGVPVDDALAGSLNAVLRKKSGNAELRRVFGKEGGWKKGDTLKQPDLARTLKRLAEKGAKDFYEGDTAALLVKEMKPGLITAADLKGYEAKVRKPVRGTYRGHDVYAPPPPSSGGVCLVQMLNILESFDLKKDGRFSPATLHRMAEAMRRAYADRASHLGDGVEVPAHLTSKEYGKKLAASIGEKATPSEKVAPEIELADEKPSTTHYSIIDAAGMAVSTTTTLEDSFGSRIVVKGAGFVLNNEMTDFNPRPGVTTRSGRIGTGPNLIAPGKRMLSSMCPTLVVKDGRAVLVTGSPGGRTIINTVVG
ncbi:MAG: gamma-glutamyltransferase, partial [Gemmataceae bacterium]|nr:gamma-glutamyltransferase [Gemmataceae bacterium]